LQTQFGTAGYRIRELHYSKTVSSETMKPQAHSKGGGCINSIILLSIMSLLMIKCSAQLVNDEWTDVLTLGWPNNTYLGLSIDVGRIAFNDIFETSYSTPIIRRLCPNCWDGTGNCTNCRAQDHREIYYKRIGTVDGFDAYGNMKETWSSTDNILGTDFNLFSTFEDALSDTNAWAACKYDDYEQKIGAFRDCGPDATSWEQWTGDVFNLSESNAIKAQSVLFSIYTPEWSDQLTLGNPDNTYLGIIGCW